jgi:hypothetical protein
MSLAGGLAGNLNPFQGLANSLSGGSVGGGGGGFFSSLRGSASSLSGMSAPPMSGPMSGPMPPPPPPPFTHFGGYGNFLFSFCKKMVILYLFYSN